MLRYAHHDRQALPASEKNPSTMRSNPGLRILMSITDFDTCDDELTNKTVKGVDYTINYTSLGAK